MPNTRMLTIRQWMVVGIAVFVVLAALFYHFSNVLDQNVLEPLLQPQSQQSGPSPSLDSTLREIALSPANWRDPGWQASMSARLASQGAALSIQDPAGGRIFATGNMRPGDVPTRQMAVVQAVQGGPGEQPLGTIALYAPAGGIRAVFSTPLLPLPAIGAILAVTVALFFVRAQMGRYVVKPLEAMGVAAQQIADGNLDFQLPESRVREVADVSQAFEAMGQGLRDSLKRQADLEEERRFFIGAIAHDLRTPLFSLRGYLEGLEQGLASSPEKVAGYVAVCRQKADQLDRLVSDLFAYTRVEYLEETLQWGRLDLGALLRRAVEGANPQAQDKAITLQIREPSETCSVQGDEPLLERAVENLLDNALRYTPAGGNVCIEWHLDRGQKQVVFAVADTGPGIAPADMPHLFDPLYRGETSRNRQTGGAGLGLAIARRALLVHGGDLVAANCPDGGARFTGTLPLCRPE